MSDTQTQNQRSVRNACSIISWALGIAAIVIQLVYGPSLLTIIFALSGIVFASIGYFQLVKVNGIKYLPVIALIINLIALLPIS